ncbi:MAG: single-stranded DNA-binding protein [Proteobacteria bacterium]|nr:single-stranded DNA-binding protein [Pseudomonadota bacterium]
MRNNYVRIKGNLGNKPDIRKTQDGKEAAFLSVAVTDRYCDKVTKEWKNTDTQWFKCAAFTPLEVSEAKQLSVGSLVSIEGKLKTTKYKDDSGQDRVGIEIIISSLEEVVRRKVTSEAA